jgi:hypothetical protein
VAITIAYLAMFFDRTEQPEVAATLYGAASRYGSLTVVVGLAGAVDRLRAVLGRPAFDDGVATGGAMDLGDSVAYARDQIRLARPTVRPT